MLSVRRMAQVLAFFWTATAIAQEKLPAVGSFGAMTGPATYGIKSRPFSADFIEATDRFRADGVLLHYESHGSIFRDTDGRMRIEREHPDPDIMVDGARKMLVEIVDPVLGITVEVATEAKHATIRHWVFTSLPPHVVQHPRSPVQPSRPRTGQSQPKETPTPNPLYRSSHDTLDPMNIEGFSASRTRDTVISRPTAGTDQPSTIVHERWFSQDLMMELEWTEQSPWVGKRTLKVVNIRSGQPDPLLFQAPQDYKVTDQEIRR